MGCCLIGCLRLVFFQIWKLALAAILAMLFTRADSYVENRHGDTTAGKAWRAYRSRGKKNPPTPPSA